jgi:hypothetical protein
MRSPPHHCPADGDGQAHNKKEVKPFGATARRIVLARNVVFTVGATNRVLVNSLALMRTGLRGVLILVSGVPIGVIGDFTGVVVRVPIFLVVVGSGHREVLRDTYSAIVSFPE